jgi:hypothetical protein
MIPTIQIQGLKTFELTGRKVTSAPRKLDTLSVSYQTDREDTFARGGPLPGYPFIDIVECETLIEIPGQAYQHNLRGEGLLRPGHKLESNGLRQPEEGWDEGPQTWLTTKPEDFAIGNVHPDISTLWCVGLDDKEQVTDRIWRITPNYRGIILDANGDPKPATWKITVNGETMNTTGTVVLGTATPEVFTDEDGNWNGWASARKASFDVSKVNLVKTVLSTTAPPTDRVGLSLTPEYIPAIYNIFDSPAWFASGFTYNYPSGWKLASVQSSRVLDKDLYLYTLTYEYNPIAIPTL